MKEFMYGFEGISSHFINKMSISLKFLEIKSEFCIKIFIKSISNKLRQKKIQNDTRFFDDSNWPNSGNISQKNRLQNFLSKNHKNLYIFWFEFKCIKIPKICVQIVSICSVSTVLMEKENFLLQFIKNQLNSI